MPVIATAGHVDHGKSTLVQALTGRDPDRYAEEKRRGMTLDLGFAWTTLPNGAPLAFVDVPGHERFVATMLAGVGPVPAVMVVVAANEGWRAQTTEHVAAIDALGARHGLLVITKCDLGDPQPVIHDAQRRLRGTSLASVAEVQVSVRDVQSVEQLRSALAAVADSLPAPDPTAPVRLWVDRAFTIRGSGTVVTGTLGGGRIAVGDRLRLAGSDTMVVAREVQSMDRSVPVAEPVARVALNLRAVPPSAVRRGTALVTPGAWTLASLIDVRLDRDARLPRELVVHIGSAAVTARPRPLDEDVWRLRLGAPLPLHVGDRLVLRDPAAHLVLAGADVLDVAAPPLRGHGAAAGHARQLREPVSADGEIGRRGWIAADELTSHGHREPPTQALRLGRWWVAPAQFELWERAVTESAGRSVDEVAREIGAPTRDIVLAIVERSDRLQVSAGEVVATATTDMPDSPELAALLDRFAADPFDAPESGEVTVDPAELARAGRQERVLHLGRGLLVGATAPDVAIERLLALAQPFTMSEARQALGTSRRVAVPLLEHLDALRRTRRVDSGHRIVVR